MEVFYRRALRNIVRHGDTDIFPFPIENHILHDRPDEAVAILTSLDADVSAALAQHPPTNVGALAPVGYTGFRWAVQIDPIWNAAYLSWIPSHIVEFKDGDRAFRSYEFRQLSVYAALYLNETGDVPESIEVLNSRRGVYMRIGLSDFSNEVAGQSAVDYLREIIRMITDETASM